MANKLPRRSLALRTATLWAAVITASGCNPKPAPHLVPTCTLPVPTVTDWRLRGDGTAFRDADGRMVFLRGVDAGGRSKLAPYVPFDFAVGSYTTALGAYMDRAASWGINVMRVPFTWAALEPTQGHDDQGWLSLYDQLLDAAWARGIFTIIDFHQDVYAETFCGDGFPPWTIVQAPAAMTDCPNWQSEYYSNPDVTSAFDRFWASGSSVQTAYGAAWDVMVARYKDKPGVLGFEPINEPGWGTADVSTFEMTTLTSFYSTMVARMRNEAPTSLVFVGGPGVDGLTASTNLARPGGDGIVFAPHFYPLTAEASQVQAGLTRWANLGTAWGVPVFVGEFGTSNASSSAETFIAAHFDALDTLGLSGSEWEYSVSAELWNGETDSIVGADGGEYPVAQAIVRPFARAIAGSGIVQRYDASTGVFDLTYAPGAGTAQGTQISQVSLPSRAYPAGYNLTLTGACVDSVTAPGQLLLQPNSDATEVSLHVTRN